MESLIVMPRLAFIFVCFFLFLLTAGGAMAQVPRTGSIAGKVSDALNASPLEAVTISAVLAKDSVLINYVSSNSTGRYRLTKLPLNKPFEVFVTRKGYRDTSAIFTLTADGPSLDSIDWLIAVQPLELKGVSIVASRAPFTYRNDTLEFNATAYKVKPNGTVRDLLNKLPGVVIDDKGGITIYGKKVDRIQLEGGDFYAENMDMAVENLPADIIEKVQVTTTKTDLARLTPGPKKRSENLTINLTLKKNKKQGLLGKIGAAVGTADRYSGDISTNRMGGRFRFSGNASAGNVPRGNISAMGSMMGIGSSQSAAVSAGGKLGKKIKLDLDYGVNGSNNRYETKMERTNFLPDSSFTNTSVLRNDNKSSSHRISTRINYQADSLTTWLISLSASSRNNKNNSYNNSAAMSEEGLLINATEGGQANRSKDQGLSGDVTFSRQSRNRKFTLGLQYHGSLHSGDGKGEQYSVNTFLKAPSDTLDQRSVDENVSSSQSIGAEVNYVVRKNLYLSGSYGINYSANKQRRETFNATPDGYTDRDTLLSAYNKMENITQTPNIGLQFRNDKLGVSINSGWSVTEQRSRFLWRDSSVVIKQQQFSPSMNADYHFGNGSINASYNVNTSAPSPQYTSPVIDNRNPLAVIIGNPALKNSIDHGLTFSVNAFMPQKGIGAHVSVDASLSQNQIVQDISYDSLRRQVTRYRNANGAARIGLGSQIFYAKKIGDWITRAGIGANAGSSNEVSYLDSKRNESVRTSLAGNVNVGANYKDWGNISGNIANRWEKSTNSLQGLSNNKTLALNYSCVLEVTGLKRAAMSLNYNYAQNSQLAPDMGRRMHKLGASVEGRFLKKENLTLSLSVNDLFNNQQEVSRRVTSAYVENRTGNV